MITLIVVILVGIVVIAFAMVALVNLFVTHDDNGLIYHHESYQNKIVYTQGGKHYK